MTVRPTWADWREVRMRRYVEAWGTDDCGCPRKETWMRQHVGGINVHDLLVLMPYWVATEDGEIIGRWAQ